MKANPQEYSTDAEKYLQCFWTPTKGHKVTYRGDTYTIKDILEAQASLDEEPTKALWLQDLAWKPSLEDCDSIATRFNGQILTNQIMFKKDKQRCFFKKPDSIDEYRDIIRQLRVLNHFHETK